MKNYFLKIGEGNTLAKAWLEGNNPTGKPAAVIYFRHTHVKDLLSKKKYQKKYPQAVDFCKAGLPENRRKTRAVVISDGELWAVRPVSEVIELRRERKNTPKVMRVRILKRTPLTMVPPVLASIGCNRYLSSGTFREITNLGSIKAIRAVLGKCPSKKHYRPKYLKSIHLLECLSSVELETLIAKILESVGCFVPAYRGGYMKDIDLFATNDTSKKLNLGGLFIGKGKTVSLQIKTNSHGNYNTVADYLIALDAVRNVKVFNSDWVLEQTKHFPKASSWLARSLSWLPNDYLKHFGLRRANGG